MKIVIDIECNGLENVTKIWCIVTKDIDTGEIKVYRENNYECFLSDVQSAELVCGHGILGYDLPHLRDRLGYVPHESTRILDFLIISRLVEYSREGGHSLGQYGREVGLEKIPFNNWKEYSDEMVEYCIRDVEISHKVYDKYLHIINDPVWQPSIILEHQFQNIVNDLHTNGFAFDTERAKKLLSKIQSELVTLDTEIEHAFPPRLSLVREITPRYTKFGTLNKTDFRWVRDGDLSEYNGGPFCRCGWESFNPSSHSQIVRVLAEAKWRPVDKTTAHIDALRRLQRLKREKQRTKELDVELNILYTKILKFEKTGYKVNETNLSTLPLDAPAPARTLAKRILLEARRRTLTEWLSLVQDDGRIHGKFLGIGAWTHRMAHQNPNTANIPRDDKLYGGEMRSLWRAPRRRLLVGVDAESIQFRIFAHYVNDKELISSIINGSKRDKTDPHSLNQRVLGGVCKSRNAAKTYIYALFLGAGIGKLAQILECSEEEAKAATDRIYQRYPGFDKLRREVFPRDAKRGYFIGLDGRRVSIPGNDQGEKRHLAFSGYLQNGEAIIMKRACLKWTGEINEAIDTWASVGKRPTEQISDGACKALQSKRPFITNFVHDEWQTETPGNMESALWVAECQSRALREVGEELKLNCPMGGSYYNDDRKDYTIGTNWLITH